MNLSHIPLALRSTLVTGAAALALAANVQAQIRPLIEPVYIAPPGVIWTISWWQLIDHGWVNQIGGHFVGQSGEIYVRSSPYTIQQVTPTLPLNSYTVNNVVNRSIWPNLSPYSFPSNIASRYATVLPATVNLTHPTPPHIPNYDPPYQFIGEGTPEIQKLHEQIKKDAANMQRFPDNFR